MHFKRNGINGSDILLISHREKLGHDFLLQVSFPSPSPPYHLPYYKNTLPDVLAQLQFLPVLPCCIMQAYGRRRMIRTSFWKIHGINQSISCRCFYILISIFRKCIQQMPGIRMTWILNSCSIVAKFHNLTAIHNCHLCATLRNNTKIME